jgi:hypothetical protein
MTHSSLNDPTRIRREDVVTDPRIPPKSSSKVSGSPAEAMRGSETSISRAVDMSIANKIIEPGK